MKVHLITIKENEEWKNGRMEEMEEWKNKNIL